MIWFPFDDSAIPAPLPAECTPVLFMLARPLGEASDFTTAYSDAGVYQWENDSVHSSSRLVADRDGVIAVGGNAGNAAVTRYASVGGWSWTSAVEGLFLDAAVDSVGNVYTSARGTSNVIDVFAVSPGGVGGLIATIDHTALDPVVAAGEVISLELDSTGTMLYLLHQADSTFAMRVLAFDLTSETVAWQVELSSGADEGSDYQTLRRVPGGETLVASYLTGDPVVLTVEALAFAGAVSSAPSTAWSTPFTDEYWFVAGMAVNSTRVFVGWHTFDNSERVLAFDLSDGSESWVLDGTALAATPGNASVMYGAVAATDSIVIVGVYSADLAFTTSGQGYLRLNAGTGALAPAGDFPLEVTGAGPAAAICTTIPDYLAYAAFYMVADDDAETRIGLFDGDGNLLTSVESENPHRITGGADLLVSHYYNLGPLTRLDVTGVEQWTFDGSSLSSNNLGWDSVSDGAGGAYTLLTYTSNPGTVPVLTRVYHVDSDGAGTLLGTIDGSALSPTLGDAWGVSCDLTSDGSILVALVNDTTSGGSGYHLVGMDVSDGSIAWQAALTGSDTTSTRATVRRAPGGDVFFTINIGEDGSDDPVQVRRWDFASGVGSAPAQTWIEVPHADSASTALTSLAVTSDGVYAGYEASTTGGGTPHIMTKYDHDGSVLWRLEGAAYATDGAQVITHGIAASATRVLVSVNLDKTNFPESWAALLFLDAGTGAQVAAVEGYIVGAAAHAVFVPPEASPM